MTPRIMVNSESIAQKVTPKATVERTAATPKTNDKKFAVISKSTVQQVSFTSH